MPVLEATPCISRSRMKPAPRPQSLSINPLSSGLWPGAPRTQVHVPFGNCMQVEKGTTTNAAFLSITQNTQIFAFPFGFRFSSWEGWWKYRFQEDDLLSARRGKAFCKEKQSQAAKLPFELCWHTSPCLFFPEPFCQGDGAFGKTWKFHFSQVKIVLPVRVTGKWSPCLYHNPWAFFLLISTPILLGRGGSEWPGGCLAAGHHQLPTPPSQLQHRREDSEGAPTCGEKN